MQKILILGKNGMLGQAIAQEIDGNMLSAIALDRNDLDITNEQAVFAKITQLNPVVVINATGYTNVDGAEVERDFAFAVNAEAVAYIVEACKNVDASLFHFSTDYIFDGTKRQGYSEYERDHICPLNVYGESKLQGERAIFDAMSEGRWFIIRTSWLYGAGGKNFVDTLITRAKEGQKEFTVVNDQFGNPTYTNDLAERVIWMIERLPQLAGGVYHATSEVPVSDPCGITWYDFAVEIFEQAREQGIIAALPLATPCTTANFPRPAPRPTYSSLLTTKLPPMRLWKEALGEHIKEWGDKRMV